MQAVAGPWGEPCIRVKRQHPTTKPTDKNYMRRCVAEHMEMPDRAPFHDGARLPLMRWPPKASGRHSDMQDSVGRKLDCGYTSIRRSLATR